jgi:hypothetical protein
MPAGRGALVDGEAGMVVRERVLVAGAEEEEAAGRGAEVGGEVVAGHDRIAFDHSFCSGGFHARLRRQAVKRQSSSRGRLIKVNPRP